MKPLFFDGQDLIFSCGNKIFSQCQNGKIAVICELPLAFYQKLIIKNRWLARLFRLEVYSAAKYSGRYFFCFNRVLFSYDQRKEVVEVEKRFDKGYGPLAFSIVSNISGFDDGIYFGEYFGNQSLDSVAVLRRSVDGSWQRIFEFPEGKIDHIHGLIPDSGRGCIWVLTGDYTNGTGIYRAEKNFTEVEPAVTGSQQYRACVAFPTERGLLYATDTHLEKNFVRLLSNEGGTYVSSVIAAINGPVIYGVETHSKFLFGTSVEPAPPTGRKFHDLMDNRPGAGILKNEVQIVSVDKVNLVTTVLLRNPKDCLPPRLFKFGSVAFPFSPMHSDTVPIYFTATRFAEGQLSWISATAAEVAAFEEK